MSQPQDCDETEGNIEGEDPAPRGEVGNDAAENGAQYRAGHDRRSPQCEHPTVVLLRIDVEEDSLRQWLNDSGRRTLDEAEWDQRSRGGRDRAEHGAKDEQADRAGEELPRAIAATEPAGQGRHYSRGAEIARHDPGAEIDPTTQVLLELRQCHIG